MQTLTMMVLSVERTCIKCLIWSQTPTWQTSVRRRLWTRLVLIHCAIPFVKPPGIIEWHAWCQKIRGETGSCEGCRSGYLTYLQVKCFADGRPRIWHWTVTPSISIWPTSGKICLWKPVWSREHSPAWQKLLRINAVLLIFSSCLLKLTRKRILMASVQKTSVMQSAELLTSAGSNYITVCMKRNVGWILTNCDSTYCWSHSLMSSFLIGLI